MSIINGLLSIPAIIARALAPVFNSYINYINIVNAGLANFFAPVANFLAPLVARAPWLANVARFFQPLARFAPLFKVLQGLLMLAAIPYVVAAAVGLAVAVYSTIARFFVNVYLVIRDYFFDNNSINLPNVSHQFKVHSLLGAIARAPFFAVARLCVVVVGGPIFITFDALNAGREAFVNAYNATLDLPVFQIMRSAWSTHPEIAKPVSDEQIRMMADGIMEINDALGREEYGRTITFAAIKNIRDLIQAIDMVPSIPENRRTGQRRIQAWSNTIQTLTTHIAQLREGTQTSGASIKQLTGKLTAIQVELQQQITALGEENSEQRALISTLVVNLEQLLLALNNHAHFHTEETVVSFTPQARNAFAAAHETFVKNWYDVDAVDELSEEQDVNERPRVGSASSLRHDSV